MDERFEAAFEPRPETGGTMVIGDGLYNLGGMRYLRDMVEFVGPWVDSYKFQRAALALQPTDLLQRKLDLFEANDIVAFPGGNFFEAMALEGAVEDYFETLRDIGCPGVEISTTSIELALAEKAAQVERAAEMGFHVHAEIGKKESESGGTLSIDETIAEMDACLDAGADVLILEMEQIQASMADEEGIDADVLARYLDRYGKEDLLFEVPLASYYEVMTASWRFIEAVGNEVNLGNLSPEHVMPLEQQRRGVGQYAFQRR